MKLDLTTIAFTAATVAVTVHEGASLFWTIMCVADGMLVGAIAVSAMIDHDLTIYQRRPVPDPDILSPQEPQP